MKTDICKLCGQQKELIGKSHIIPRHFHLYTTTQIKKYFDEVVTDTTYIYSLDGKEKQVQNGLYVGGLLCGDCENSIGRWDKYAQNLLLKEIDIDAIAEKQEVTREVQTIPNVDYKLLKLFFMSLLWRSHIARDHFFVNKVSKDGKIETAQFFKEVNLGQQWELKLKSMILQENPGTEDDFSVVLIKYIGKESYVHLLPPKRIKNDSANFYQFTFAGYSFFIKVDQRKFLKKVREIMLKPNSPMYFPIKKYKDSPDYLHLLKWVNSVPEMSI
ncbi:hypothetical protein [Aulosira sp. FACHB-615]|uniref:hypothetical protein n=1 Tax=Aulosira sp. FACHB-615 TaxID=2692777 RepID=UPI001682EB38|nr:hypothetical protein [Aulosira sp. FACHB-615]MBD2492413.1 hypothetical protein [Aulosira sp. FACHB-615]